MATDELKQLLRRHGPSRSTRLTEALQREFGLTPAAARKRVSRARAPILRFPVPLLPKRESFLYLEDQRSTELFWTNFIRDLRETNSVYGAALDALAARRGVVRVDEFPVISGAPLALKKQVSSNVVASTLVAAGAVITKSLPDAGECLISDKYAIVQPDIDGVRARSTAEGVILDGIREWARKLGMASYNRIAIRGEDHPRQLGQFKWDLTGPSYLLPLRRGPGKPGFLAADVFAEGVLDAHSIQYFIRKVQLLRATSNSGDVLPILVAEGFTGAALKAGHVAGVVLATPSNLFGHRVGAALQSLLTVLKKAAAIAAGNPAKLASLIDDLSEIEGAALNLRGILFELISAYLAKLDGSSVDFGITARDPDNGKTADIDVLKVLGRQSCTAVECKGKAPSGIVELHEVETWLSRIPTFRAHLRAEQRFREIPISFEIWTTGTFSADALERLASEKRKRTKYPIDWKDGAAIRALAKKGKEKAICKALDEHFFEHPLAMTD